MKTGEDGENEFECHIEQVVVAWWSVFECLERMDVLVVDSTPMDEEERRMVRRGRGRDYKKADDNMTCLLIFTNSRRYSADF